MSRIISVLSVVLVLSLISCDKIFPVDVGQSTGRGIVRRIDTVHHQVTLSHGSVPNLLYPMTYAYPVKSDAVFHGIHEGDTVSFAIEESQPGSFRVLSMQRIHIRPSRTNVR